MDSDTQKCDYCKKNYNLLLNFCLHCKCNFTNCKYCVDNFTNCGSFININNCINKYYNCNKCHYRNCTQCWSIHKFRYLNYDLQNIILIFLLSLKRTNITNKIIPKYLRHIIVHYIVINVF